MTTDPGTTTGPDLAPTSPDGLRDELARLWAEIFGVAAVDPAVDFTELGGNSLHAARVAARIRGRHGADLTVRELFEARTVAGLAHLLDQRLRHRADGSPTRAAALPPVRRAPGEGPAYSLGQRRLWFLDHLSPAAGVSYNVAAAARLHGPLDRAALEAAWASVARRHEQLRTTFLLVDGELDTRVHDAVAPLRTTDLSGHPAPEQEALDRAARLAAEHIDLGREPLPRPALFRLGEDDHLLVLVLPHLIADGRTLDVIDRDLARAYRQHTGGPDEALPEPALSYRDFAHWQQELAAAPDADARLAPWRSYLQDAPTTLDLPADHPRPAVRSHRGRRVTRRTGSALLTAARELAAATRTTPYAVCLAAYGLLLGELTGRRDLLVASPTDGRPEPALEDVVGFFTNTVPVRLRPGGGSFREAVKEAHGSALDAVEHQYVPFERLAAEFAPAGDLSRTPLAQVALAYQGPLRPHAELAGLTVRPRTVDNGTAKFDLTLEVHEDGEEFVLSAEYSTDLFTEQRTAALLDRYVELLASALDGPDHATGPDRSAVPVQAAAATSNGAPDWQGRCLHEVFAEVAARHPEAIAVTDGTRRLSYAELDRAANRLAHRLRRHGADVEQLVGLCAERTVDLVVGLLAILKSGAGYLPLDPRHPAARLDATLTDAGCRLLVGDAESCEPLLGSAERTLVRLDEPLGDGPLGDGPQGGEPGDGRSADDESVRPPQSGVGPDNVAYVIYTSGSTGKPKGVVVTHANVTRLFTATTADFGFGADDVWTLFHSIAFDFSVWELWGPLLYGGRLVLVPYLVSRDPMAFLELLRTEQVTVLNQTPTAFRHLAAVAEDAGFPPLALRTVVFGGEALDPAMLRGWAGGYGTARPRLVNMYGITETTVHVTVRPIGIADLTGSTSPIGRPIGDLRVHVLDERMAEVPPGTEGEMYIGGPGVARGYLNRPELTDERFVQDPFGAPGERLYRSGDLAVRLPDGELEYRGRADQQIKLHGFRIELGEIERALLDQPGVRSAACVLREDTPGVPRLVGYLVPAPGRPLDAESVRSALAQRLPAHMLPAAFVQLPALPLTANGKLDKTQLPAPGTEAAAAPGTQAAPAARTAPRTETERRLAEVWHTVLRGDEPDVHANFFAVGGDSIIAIRLGVAARAAGLPVTIESIFRNPTVAELARHCELTAAAEQPAGPAEPAPLSTTLADLDPDSLPEDVTDAYPTAAMQLAIVYECELADDEESGLYHDLISVRVDGAFDRTALEAALADLGRRHEILRTSFHLGLFREPMQLVHRQALVPLTVEDRHHGPELGDKEREALLHAWWEREKADPFYLDEPPLVRCAVLHDGPQAFQLSLAVHHSILDGWSLARLMTELLLAYDARLGATDAALPDLPRTRYRDFVAAEQAALADPAARDYWAGLLPATAPAAELPVLPGGGSTDEFAFHAPLPAELDAELDLVAAELGIPVKSVYYAAHAWALGRLTGRADTVGAMQVNGRMEQEGGDLVLGLLLNMVPVHVRVDGGRWADLARAAFDAERERQPHRRYPLAAMQQLVGRDHRLFEVAFNYTDFHAFDDLDALARIRTGDWWFSDRHSFPLMLELTRSPHTGERALSVTVGVDSPLAGTGARLGELVLEALRQIAADPHAEYPAVGGA
ncbi:amino acid adenylation domain-containing protein [Kitasatospora sp. NPDC028055]|uniref:non-ribosomal peptide synthetase n=1 Tax=Kitasatospora sp. NPDC028055 TaxID=3155653 RepID=UPI0034032DA1